jgi:glycosyltransferase involved in cell wall biosynthesis
MRCRVAFFSVVPSPYQRDLFHALSQRDEVELRVFYLEAAAPDSPWPEKPLAPYEKILPGFWFALGGARCHVNWPLPDIRGFDLVVMNTLMSITGQWLMRASLRRKRWIFWGEKLGRRTGLHARLSAPLHRASAIAAIGSRAKADYQARFPEPASFDIPYHCDLQPFSECSTRTASGRDCLPVLRQMIARKGVDLLLEAFRLVGRGKLLLVGREAELPQLLAALPAEVRERITYAGFQAPDALPQFFAQADVFVLPSRYDGWGVVVNQALGAGLPIVCSDEVGAGFDLVEEDRNGLRFRAGDSGSLAEQLRRFVDAPELAGSWGAASRAKAPDWLPEAGAAKWVHAIQQVLAR